MRMATARHAIAQLTADYNRDCRRTQTGPRCYGDGKSGAAADRESAVDSALATFEVAKRPAWRSPDYSRTRGRRA